MSEYTKIPARVLMQIREGKRLNVMAEFEIDVRNSTQDANGNWTHEVPVSGMVAGLADALKPKIDAMLEDITPAGIEYLHKLRDWLFEEVPS